MRRFAVALCVLALAACGGPEPLDTPLPQPSQRLELSSPDFEDSGDLPAEVTCDGKGEPPALQWGGLPQGTAELALVLVDLDAPAGVLAHWVTWGIGPERTRLEPGVGLPEAQDGETSFGRQGYEPPCPPEGDEAHRYVFALYALSGALDLPEGAAPGTVLAQIGRLALAGGRLEGTYRR